MARRVNRLMRGALERFVESETFSRMHEGEARDLAFPSGMAAEAVQVVRLDRRMSGLAALLRVEQARLGELPDELDSSERFLSEVLDLEGNLLWAFGSRTYLEPLRRALAGEDE